MFPVSVRSSSRRRRLFFVLVATTAASALLGGCNKSGPKMFGNNASGLPSQMASLTGKQDTNKAVSQWAAAYGKRPSDPKMVLGYAYALKATGNKSKAFGVLQRGYAENPTNGEIAANLGRLALEMNRPDIAKPALHLAAAQGVDDWRTLSAQGTLLAKRGQHAEAQKYFQAALRKEPRATSVINNLALSYALDGKAAEAEGLLKKAVANGANDKRIRQNLALVLGVQGKYGEAKKIAAVDLPEAQANAKIAKLEEMLNRPTQVAMAEPEPVPEPPRSTPWNPFGANEGKPRYEPVRTASVDNSGPAGNLPVWTSSRSLSTAPEPKRIPVPEQLAPPPKQAAPKQINPTQVAVASAADAVAAPAAPKPVLSIAKPYIEKTHSSSAIAKSAPAASTQIAANEGTARDAASLLRSDLR
ncbi:tetratricopeptide repeat protein [Methyloligella sp. 2.7D]|uniref:tetratricopeptide repeat protein n=1 Tax=unclassified Methyloligella TaxID=2625955 RepID=UPI00157CCA5E|nr:tetratricopeptide repeat protein [Methyloligella sp. GL2]QKP78582.1 hypothetical protein HT051_14750 [Methyloligella sp. GL2]